jgi:Uma2 family endonuclease
MADLKPPRSRGCMSQSPPIRRRATVADLHALSEVAGWRRERMVERPRERPMRLLPDWVCEILSASNAANDTVTKLRVLHRHRVPHYWLLDPSERTLRVLRWTEPGYLEVLSATADETGRAEPFDAMAISLSAVMGID